MSHNPCHQDCTDFPDPDVTDHGCCVAASFRRDCEAPVLPSNDCDEEGPVVEYDEETEGFKILSKLYDSNCSPLSDSDGSILTGLVA